MFLWLGAITMIYIYAPLPHRVDCRPYSIMQHTSICDYHYFSATTIHCDVYNKLGLMEILLVLPTAALLSTSTYYSNIWRPRSVDNAFEINYKCVLNIDVLANIFNIIRMLITTSIVSDIAEIAFHVHLKCAIKPPDPRRP